MTAWIWLRGLIWHRPARLVATALGVAVGVALLASIGTFLSATTSQMTHRAIARVPVDWQVQAAPGTDPAQLLAAVRRDPAVRRALAVTYLSSPGLAASSQASTQTTGAAQILGLPPGYAQAFPGELRLLSGRLQGALLAQQTASNLHAAPGSVVLVSLPDGRQRRVIISGIVDLPAADSLFQHVGAPAGAQPSAPPDNVVLLPASELQRLGGMPATTQIHAIVSHALPASPSAAYTAITGAANNLASRLAGGGSVADNLAVALDSARQDALYAELLFLFLGLPGVVLAGLLTILIASAGADRRRRDAALLRTRGASTRALVALALAETALAGLVGIGAGLAAALLIGSSTFGTSSFGAGAATAIVWAVGASLAGLLIAAGAVALPAIRDARTLTVAGQRREVGRQTQSPRWARLGLDVIALAIGGVVLWQASQSGYQLVLAPEGVAQVSVNWYALLAPGLGWLGLGLIVLRITRATLAHGQRGLARLVRPLAGELALTVTATMSRRRGLLARAVALAALALAFAASTSVFDSTYRAQAEVDARLTNGADVAVTEPSSATVSPAQGRTMFARVAGVASVEPLQHRYAYIGPDLQDLYGVAPQTIGRQGRLQNAWFAGGTAAALMRALAREPSAILVSQETVHDYQLHPGDRLMLRLQDARGHRLVGVPFHYIGVAKEFPTAPKDSFFIANAAYVTTQTHSPAVGTFLIQTDGTSPARVAQRLTARVGPAVHITNIVDQRQVTGSNLTAVELSGLMRIELAFALVLAVVATGVTLGLGFGERRRTFAIAAAIGARPRHLGAFVWTESLFVCGVALLLGAGIAALLSRVLVDVLTGVFDPPPDALTIPWIYLLAVAAVTLLATMTTGALAIRMLTRPAVEQLRDL